jgi:hypothetical protein
MSVKSWWVAALCGAVMAWPAAAQEPEPEPKPKDSETAPKDAPAEAKPDESKPKRAFEEPPLHRWGGLRVSAYVWQPSLGGADDAVATRFNGTSQGLNAALTVSNDPALSDGYGATWTLPHQIGAIDFGYDAIKNTSPLQRLDPGTFLYGETLVLSDFAGVADNGYADGFRAQSVTKSRRFRVEYSHTAFESPRAKGTWHAGLRFVGHSKDVQATYYALAPNLPPILPPSNVNPDFLAPRSDFGQWQSDFSGTGVGAGFDAQYHVHPRVDVVGGFSLGLVTGKQKLQYRSRTHFYLWTDPLLPHEQIIPTFDELVGFLGSVTDTQALAQLDAAGSLIEDNASQAAEDFEGYLGVEGRVWRTLRLFLHVRAWAMLNAATELRPTSVALSVTGTGFAYAVTDYRRTEHSVAYQGIVLGVSYRF